MPAFYFVSNKFIRYTHCINGLYNLCCVFTDRSDKSHHNVRVIIIYAELFISRLFWKNQHQGAACLLNTSVKLNSCCQNTNTSIIIIILKWTYSNFKISLEIILYYNKWYCITIIWSIFTGNIYAFTMYISEPF